MTDRSINGVSNELERSINHAWSDVAGAMNDPQYNYVVPIEAMEDDVTICARCSDVGRQVNSHVSVSGKSRQKSYLGFDSLRGLLRRDH